MNTKFLQVNGGTIAYDDQGTGPLLLCVPGMGDVRAQYRFLTPKLVEAGYRVVTMDMRGYGESSANWSDYAAASVGADMLALIRHQQAGPAIVVGHSYAGRAAAWAALEAPELVASLVLIGAFVRNDGPSLPMRLFLHVLFDPFWGRAAWGWYYTSLYPKTKPADFEEYRRNVLANLAEKGRMNALKRMMFDAGTRVQEHLGQIKAPVLVVMGSKDPDFKDPVMEAETIAGWTHGKSHLVEDAGHYPHAQFPERTAPAIIAFLQESREAVRHGN